MTFITNSIIYKCIYYSLSFTIYLMSSLEQKIPTKHFYCLVGIYINEIMDIVKSLASSS